MRKSIVVLAAIVLLLPILAQSSAGKRDKREVAAPRPEYNIHNLKPIGRDESAHADFNRSIIVELPESAASPQTSTSTPPPPSPGLAIGQTSYDMQHVTSQGFQVARLAGADIVHFVWTAWDRIPSQFDNDRYVAYNSYRISTHTLNQGFGGVFVGLGELSRAGFTNMAVDEGNRAHVTLHQREDVSLPYNPWHLYFPIPGNILHEDSSLTGFGASGCDEVLWPKIATSRDGTHTAHIVAHSNVNHCSPHMLWYWRFNGSIWTGPVVIDSTSQIGSVLADDPTSTRMAVVVDVDNYASMNGLNNVAYLESITDGAGWIAGTEPVVKSVITSYSNPAGPQAWFHLTTTYDNSGILHIVWDEQRIANNSGQAAIKHWNSSRQTIRTVALGYWPTPYLSGIYNLDLAKVTLGVGDGGTTCQGQPNTDFLYVTYTRFAGPTPVEQADHSSNGYYNGELYLSSSSDGGLSWSPTRNLTNTKTPNCNPGYSDTIPGIPQRPDSVCRSEHWATINQVVSDIDMIFVSDLEAGAQPYNEPVELNGPWLLNPVNYLRFPGGTSNAPYVCPLTGPQYTSAFAIDSGNCGIQASAGGSTSGSLSISNFGNATLTGAVSVVYTNPASLPSQWLSVNGAQSLPISIPAGGPDLNVSVGMSALSLAHGYYLAEIHVAHNDTTQGTTEIFPIAFNVSPCVCHADPVCDGIVNVQDVIAVVARAFRGSSETVDAGCPDAPPAIDGVTDVDCSGSTNIVDVVKMVDVAFRGADPAVKFCSPCAL